MDFELFWKGVTESIPRLMLERDWSVALGAFLFASANRPKKARLPRFEEFLHPLAARAYKKSARKVMDQIAPAVLRDMGLSLIVGGRGTAERLALKNHFGSISELDQRAREAYLGSN